MNCNLGNMKKILKMLLVVAAPLLLVAAFYGYHFYCAKSLEKMRYSDADVSAVDAERAVSILIYIQWVWIRA